MLVKSDEIMAFVFCLPVNHRYSLFSVIWNISVLIRNQPLWPINAASSKTAQKSTVEPVICPNQIGQRRRGASHKLFRPKNIRYDKFAVGVILFFYRTQYLTGSRGYI